MLLRGLLVLVLVLNLGVAAWWALRAPPQALAPPSLPAGVPVLELVGAPAAPATTPVAAPPERCMRLGPFPTDDALEAARTAVAGSALWTAVAVQPLEPARAWRVVLPMPDRAAAQAMAGRIGAAGFTDYLVLPATGPEPSTIALGRYRNEDAARERVARLAAAGFPAQAEPVGRHALWLDLAAAPGAAPAVPGAGARELPCAGLPRGGRYTIPAPA